MNQFIGIYNPAAHMQWLLRTKNHKPDVLTAVQMERRNGFPVARYGGNHDQEYPYTLVCNNEGVDYGIPKEAVIRYHKVGTYNYAADTFAPEWLSAFDGSPVYMEDSPYAKNGVIWDEGKRRYYDGIYEHAIIRKE